MWLKWGQNCIRIQIKNPCYRVLWRAVITRVCRSADADQHRDRITRFASLKHRAKKQEKYLWTLFTPGNPSDESQLAVKSAQKLSECGNYLLFKNYFTVGEIRLSNMQTCQQHLLCPFCAALRASKSMQKYMDRIIQVMKENKKLKTCNDHFHRKKRCRP